MSLIIIINILISIVISTTVSVTIAHLMARETDRIFINAAKDIEQSTIEILKDWVSGRNQR